MAKKIVLVDDDALLRRSLAFHLEQAGYQVHTASSAEEGLAFIRRSSPDLVIMDIGLPGMDGLEALQAIKSDGGPPVIFLTARRRELDEVLGLELGADDYLTKPFDVDVLLARVKAVLRRSARPAEQLEPAPLRVGDLLIDPAAHVVSCAGRLVELTRREFDLLHVLALSAGKVVPTAQALEQVWGAEFIGQPQVVYVHIRWLREKLESDPDHPQRILTVRGIGYKLVAQTAG